MKKLKGIKEQYKGRLNEKKIYESIQKNISTR